MFTGDISLNSLAVVVEVDARRRKPRRHVSWMHLHGLSSHEMWLGIAVQYVVVRRRVRDIRGHISPEHRRTFLTLRIDASIRLIFPCISATGESL